MENKRYVYAIRIFNKDGYQPTAELAFGDGGRPTGETEVIRWDIPAEREKYIINAYTLIWDEREPVKEKSFSEYIGRTKNNNYSICNALGYCPFNNKVEGFPCKDCPRKEE